MLVSMHATQLFCLTGVDQRVTLAYSSSFCRSFTFAVFAIVAFCRRAFADRVAPGAAALAAAATFFFFLRGVGGGGGPLFSFLAFLTLPLTLLCAFPFSTRGSGVGGGVGGGVVGGVGIGDASAVLAGDRDGGSEAASASPGALRSVLCLLVALPAGSSSPLLPSF